MKPVLVVDSLGEPLGPPVLRLLEARLGPVERLDGHTGDPGARDLDAYAGIVLTGSPSGVNDREPWIAGLGAFAYELTRRAHVPPTLGICFGHQLLAWAQGSEVVSRPPARRGIAVITLLDRGDPLFEGLPERITSIVAHQDQVVAVPEGFVRTASSEHAPVQGLRHRTRPIWGVQFHPDFDRELIRGDEARHPEWAAVSDAQVAGCEAPVILENFARMIRG